MNPATQVAVPISMTNLTKALALTHSEFYGTIATTATTFTVQASITAQPGLNTSFPWLANIAANYDKYQFTELYLHYVPSCPTSTPGTIYFGFDPDVLDAGPIETSDMLQYQVNHSGSPFLEHIMHVTPDILNKKLFTRTANQVISQADLKTYDIGKFYVVTDQTTFPTALGFIKLCYTVKFFNPQPRADGYIGNSCVYNSISGALFDAVVVNNLPLQIPTVADTNGITIKTAGIYEVYGFIFGSANITMSTVTGGVAQNLATASGTVTCAFYNVLTVTGPGTWSAQTTNPGSVTITKVL